MRMIELHKATSVSPYADSDDVNEPQVTADAPLVSINPDSIRCFYPRKKHHDGTPRIGTRITFKDGGGFAVTETYEEVKALVAPTIN